ncbi:MAG: FHA domain-containing protein [Lachnospiraceae bacterium]|nr:FHA domain-containing protein [Lachnospiraceae bacterium]
MQAEYRRDTHYSYLVLFEEEADPAGSFQKRMFLENAVPGFLSCRMHEFNCNGKYFYDISSRQSLKNSMEAKALDGAGMETLLTSLIRALNGLQEYLLDTGGFCLQPEWIFSGQDGKSFEFCYYPGGHQDWKEQLRLLAEYLLPRLDYRDSEAVRLGYGFYQAVIDNRITVAELEQIPVKEQAEERAGTGKQMEHPVKSEMTAQDETVAAVPVASGRDALLEAFFEAEESREESDNSKKKEIAAILELVLPICLGGAGVFLLWYFGYDGGAFALTGITGAVVLYMVFRRWKKKKEQERDAAMEQYVLVQDWLEEEKEEEKMLARAEHAKEKEEEFDEGATCLLTDEAVYRRLAKGYLVPDSQTGGETIAINQERTMIGKSSQMDIVLRAIGISRIHARITCRGEQCFLTDLNSRNGTRLNGVLLKPEEEQILADGDRISFANTGYEWRCYRL